MTIVYRRHQYQGGEVTFATRADRNDPFSLALRGDWKPDTHTLAASQLLGANDLFLDLGANVGTFCLPTAKATGASCVAVEALRSNIPPLQAAIAANELERQVEWWLAAITEKEGEVKISGESAYGTVQTVGQGRRVLSYSLDGLMNELGWPRVTMVKMDIEGCEMRALQGAKKFFEKNPDVIFIYEANAAHCYSNSYQPQALIRYFEDRGNIVYLARAGRIIRRTSSDLQESGVSDYIACPFPLEDRLRGFLFSDFDTAYKIGEVVRMLTKMKPGYRLQMVSQMDLAEARIRDDPQVTALCAKVREFPKND